MILRILILLMATAAAGGAAWLTVQAGAGQNSTVVETRPELVAMAEVLVASTEISGGDVLTPEKLRWEPWPEVHLNHRFITRAARPNAVEELGGSFVRMDLASGDPIRESSLTKLNENLLSSRIEPGMRAAAVRVSAESAAGGFILPGDRVDVIQIATLPDGDLSKKASRIIISNVRVLAIDQTAAQTPEANVLGKTATLELTPAEAALIMAAEASGMLSLALRSVADHADAEPVSAPAATVLVRRGTERSTVNVR